MARWPASAGCSSGSRPNVMLSDRPTAAPMRWRASRSMAPVTCSIRLTTIRPRPARFASWMRVQPRRSRIVWTSAPTRARCSRVRRSTSRARAGRLTPGMIATCSSAGLHPGVSAPLPASRAAVARWGCASGGQCTRRVPALPERQLRGGSAPACGSLAPEMNTWRARAASWPRGPAAPTARGGAAARVQDQAVSPWAASHSS